ncbi:MAG: hypothetical protein FWD94_00300 [Treponema sp.]|nr:hypothetical protein [Treponema sp.]
MKGKAARLYALCLLAGVSLMLDACYNPEYTSTITSCYFNLENERFVIERPSGETYSVEVRLPLRLRPSYAAGSAFITWDVFRVPPGWQVEFDKDLSDRTFDEKGSAQGVLVVYSNTDSDYACFTVQARVTEPGPEPNYFLAFAQIEVVMVGGEDFPKIAGRTR